MPIYCASAGPRTAKAMAATNEMQSNARRLKAVRVLAVPFLSEGYSRMLI